MRTITRTLLLFLTAGLLQAQDTQAQSSMEGSRYTFTSDTQLFIDGTSSVHDWTCDVEKSTGGFVVIPSEGVGLTISEGSVTVLVEDIECGKGTMNKKLKNALTINDAESIAFVLSAADVTAQQNGTLELALKGDLTIAGTTKSVDLTASGTLQNDMIRFEGSYSLLQTDFGVDPPPALFGLVKAHDDITIRFHLTAQAPEVHQGMGTLVATIPIRSAVLEYPVN
ncbi:MAG: YceI family protein [Bacteroidota bacterium]|nr:YceI family protein [Bacteroidota bacterium]